MTEIYAESTYSNDTLEPLRHDATRDIMVADDWNDSPPPYTLIAGDASILTENDGRVRLDVNSKLARTLSVLIKDQDTRSWNLKRLNCHHPSTLLFRLLAVVEMYNLSSHLVVSSKSLVTGSG
jgi:hypothetical protein